MRSRILGLLVVLVVSAAASAVTVQYACRHPDSIPGRLVGRIVGLCTTGPGIPRSSAQQPLVLPFDDAELPAPLIPMSPELQAACRWDLSELHALSAMAKSENGDPSRPTVQPVVAQTEASEDEFTYPQQEPAEPSVLLAGERIRSYPTPLPDDAVEELPPPTPTEAKPPVSPESPSQQTGKTPRPGLEIELCLAGLPAITAPQIGVQHVARQILDGCAQAQAACCSEKKPTSPTPQVPSSCEVIRLCEPQCEGKVSPILQALTSHGPNPETRGIIIVIKDLQMTPPAPMPPMGVMPPMPLRIEHPLPFPILGLTTVPPPAAGEARNDSPARSCPACCCPDKAEGACCAEKGRFVRRIYPVADLLDPSEDETPEHLIRVLCRTVAPKLWEETGGCGVVDFFPLAKALVVYHREEVHDQIAELLAELRSAVAEQTGADPELRRARFADAPPSSTVRRAKSDDEPCPERCKNCPETDR